MKEFPIVPANKNSIANRKKLFGVGVNDADYKISFKSSGKTVMCPFYRRWVNMLARCYSKNQEVNRSYAGCYVCDEWLVFSNFKKWMESQDWEGKHLDKDILFQGNRLYSPETCVFISKRINLLLNTRGSSRGRYMLGVKLIKGGFQVSCSDGVKGVYLGRFSSEVDAHKAYCEFKYAVISSVAEGEPEKIRSALLAYKIPKY